ncbi:hypothetical protein ABZ468_06950 [Streptomyces sp. NPDC005708]|uniref:hypothetical protein n=1 Tax=Streptomyces sp. NPDC005708 TaxID=3154564 RepID=UPI0033F5E424
MHARERRIALSVRELSGMPFARDEQCPRSQWFFGERPRPCTALAVHAAETPHTVARRATPLGVRTLAGTYVTGLIVNAHLVFGAYGCGLKGGSRVAVRADEVLLAAISLAHTRHRSARDDRGLTQASRDPPLPHPVGLPRARPIAAGHPRRSVRDWTTTARPADP